MTDASQQLPGARRMSGLIVRLIAHWRLKIALTIAINLGFWPVYFYLGSHPWRLVHSLPMTWLDAWAGFHPQGWVWIYYSQFLITGTMPLLISEAEQLRRYAIGLAGMCLAAFVIFGFFPVASPRIFLPSPGGLPAWMLNFDAPNNAFPSLHAAFLVYNMGWAFYMLRAARPRHFRPLLAIILCWAFLILFSTLATKQHYALDLLAGAVLGGGAVWLAWRNSSPSANAEHKSFCKTASGTVGASK